MMAYGGGSIKKNGVYEQVMAALDDFDVVEFGGIEPNPHYETCMKAVDIIKTEGVDLSWLWAAALCGRCEVYCCGSSV